MSRMLIKLHRLLKWFGVDFVSSYYSIVGIYPFVKDFISIKKQQKVSKTLFPIERIFLCTKDRYSQNGVIDDHYFHQDLYVARRILLLTPKRHIDIGSRIDGFISHLAVFREIEVFDIRPMKFLDSNIKFQVVDFSKKIPDEYKNCCDSISCLHALEHFGLGRYGDPINHDAYLSGISNLDFLLEAGGKLYLSVPIGPQRIEFNAHRVFSLAYLLSLFQEKYLLDRFSFIDDEGIFHEDFQLGRNSITENCGCRYGCGIFEFKKIA